MEDDAAGRAKRLRIIVGVCVAALLISLTIGVLGTRRVNDEISRIRTAATTPRVDASLIPEE